MEITTTDAPERRRYEARVDGELAAIADYIPTDELIAFTHTEVLSGFEGKGVASALIRAALDDVRAKDLKVLPVCPFVSQYLQRHPEDYTELVYRSRTRAVHD